MSYIKSKSFKIISRFYVIYGDYEPIYVGYTNRTVKQRFREHEKDKDFSDYDSVEVKELINEKLGFDFTWDYGKTCENANEVSLREGQLVQQYGTQDSVFQKADGGGQTWATEKGFVKSNKDNPKFSGLFGVEIKRLLKEEKTVSIWLRDFINSAKPVEEVWLRDFVSSMKTVEEVWLRSFINDMQPAEEVWLSNFINNMQPVEEVWLKSFIGNMKPVEEVWLNSFVSNMKPVEEVWLSHFVSHIQLVEETWLRDFVNNMKLVDEMWLRDFINHMKPKNRIRNIKALTKLENYYTI